MARDLLYALRWLHHNPFFSVTVVAILAVGIGANTATFSIVDAVLLRGLPYKSSDRLVKIEEDPKRSNGVISASDYLVLRGRSDLFEQMACYQKDFLTLTGAGSPDQLFALRTSSGLFSLLGVKAERGRTLVESDDKAAAPGTVVLSDRLWRRLFHSDPSVIGRTMTLSGTVFTVVGVMPPDFEFPSSNIVVWTSFRLAPDSDDSVQVVARTKEAVSLAQVQSAVAIIAHQFEQQDPEERAGLEIAVSRWRETPEREYRLTLIFVLVAVSFVLLIACADVSSLLLSRAVQRQREIALRMSLGAGFRRVLRQLLAESMVLALFGGLAGIAVAHYALQYLSKAQSTLSIVIPHIQRVQLNERALLFNTVVCLLFTLLSSVAPALLATQTDLQSVLRGGYAAGGSRASTRFFSTLIASETAFAFLLLVGSGLMIRSLIRLQQADHGFHPDHVLTMRVPISTSTQPSLTGRYETKPQQIAHYHDLLERLQGVPTVTAVAVVNNLPLSGSSTSTALQGPDGKEHLISTRTISSEYFSAMGIPVISGRVFSEDDQTTSPQVAIVNEYLAHRLFRDRDPIGQKLPGSEVTIVGIVKNSPQSSYEHPPEAEVYRPYQQFIFGVFLSTIVVRTSGDPLSLASTLSRGIWAIDPDQPVVKIETMNDVISDSIWRPRFSAWILSLLGALALALTCFGIYGVVAYTTALRSRELGIRVALGASRGSVVGTILRDAMLPLAAGLGISLVAGLLLSRLLTTLLYETRNTDPIAYVGASLLLLLTGAVASAAPAWRAALADPVQVLRTD
jgi:predicted permease